MKNITCTVNQILKFAQNNNFYKNDCSIYNYYF